MIKICNSFKKKDYVYIISDFFSKVIEEKFVKINKMMYIFYLIIISYVLIK